MDKVGTFIYWLIFLFPVDKHVVEKETDKTNKNQGLHFELEDLTMKPYPNVIESLGHMDL